MDDDALLFLGVNMFKSILITILLIALICSVFFIVFGKMFVKDIKSKDEIKRLNAEETLKKMNIVGYIVFVCLLVLLIIILKIF